MNVGFTYPTTGLGYIGPILMIVALVAMPVIGVFGGWKRAAYWGGGNFVFYIIGMLIWRFAGYDIAGLLNSLVGKLLAGSGVTAEFTPLVNSVLAPLFFIIFLILANIILLINYYAWFRRVSGIRKVVKKKGKDGKVTKQVVKDFDNKSTKYKVMSHIVGGFGLLALTVPTIMSFTRASLFLTTSINTRANNKFANGLYNGLNGISDKFDWISYYSNEDSATDYDAIWSALYLSTTNMDFENQWEEGDSGEMAIMQALGITLDQGFGDIFARTTDPIPAGDIPTAVKEKVGKICGSVDKLATAWNSIINADEGRAKINMHAIFSSINASAIVKQLIGIKTKDEDVKVTVERIENYKNGSFFMGVVDLFHKGSADITIDIPDIGPVLVHVEHEFVKFEELDIGQKSYDNICDALVDSYDLSELNEEQKELFRTRMDQLLNILFV